MENQSRYDSRADTRRHIDAVRKLLTKIAGDLLRRGTEHDKSKLSEPELSVFNEYTPKLWGATFMSDEYKLYLGEMKVALDHHYRVNSHHPQFYQDGINGMSLVSLTEMLCDWIAATQRHEDGDIMVSIEKNAERFGIDDQLKQILINTVEYINERV